MSSSGPQDKLSPFAALRNGTFRTLYLAEAISLFGDAFTWVGLALVSYQFGPERSAVVLASALTLRVTAYILFSPFAGVLADKVSRKAILCTSHFCRMGVVAAMAFVTAEWQLYGLVFLLNVFNGFFMPAYRAAIPHVVKEEEYRSAIGLSSATFQLLGVMGPGVAGVLAVWLGVREIFFVDALSFVVAGLLILALPRDLGETSPPESTEGKAWLGAWEGARLLWSHRYLRFALLVELLSAAAGAQILVNTIGLVKSGFSLDDRHYGWAMSVLALGSAIAALVSGNLDRTPSRRVSLVLGSLVMGASVALVGRVDYTGFLLLWLIAGSGQSLAEVPSETLIGENIPAHQQGKVYGAHFAFSHLWWAMAYPVAGVLGKQSPELAFRYAGLFVLAASTLLALVALAERKLWSTLKSS